VCKGNSHVAKQSLGELGWCI